MRACDFTALVPECCADVLEAMYFTSVLDVTHEAELNEPGAPEETQLPPGEFAFCLSFQGDVSGRFGLRLSDATARSLASNFLGDDDEARSVEQVSEVVGELANMLCGSVASRIEGERKFVLSHPQPIAVVPTAQAEDILVSKLGTDSGEITTWITVEGNA